MATVTEINGALGGARDVAFKEMLALLGPDSKATIAEKSVGLLNAQAALGITDGAQNIVAKAYNRWQQTGQ